MLLSRTRSLMGNRFLSYSARDNNCGHFVMAMLRANNLSTPVNTLFVEQTSLRPPVKEDNEYHNGYRWWCR
jgi:hypothetical protein